MSTAQDIWEVYRDEIVDKSRLVYRKGGATPFFTEDNLRIKTPFQVPDEDFIETEGIDAGGNGEGTKEEGDQEVRIKPV
jgi:hypothetical protein